MVVDRFVFFHVDVDGVVTGSGQGDGCAVYARLRFRRVDKLVAFFAARQYSKRTAALASGWLSFVRRTVKAAASLAVSVSAGWK